MTLNTPTPPHARRPSVQLAQNLAVEFIPASSASMRDCATIIDQHPPERFCVRFRANDENRGSFINRVLGEARRANATLAIFGYLPPVPDDMEPS